MSKGITDLPGGGRLAAEFRKLALGLLRHRSEREMRQLKNAEQALKNEALRLKNQALELKNRATALQLRERACVVAKKRGWSAEETQEFITPLSLSQKTSHKLLGE